MDLIHVMAMVMEVLHIFKWSKLYFKDKRDGEGDGRCLRIEAVIHVIYIMAMVMDIFIGFKL